MRLRIPLVALGVVALGVITSAPAHAGVGQMTVSWQDNSIDETGFAIERAVGSGGIPGTFVEITRTAANVELFVDRAGLVHNTQYCYRVRSLNAGGFSAFANVSGGTATFACATFQAAPPVAPSSLVVI